MDQPTNTPNQRNRGPVDLTSFPTTGAISPTFYFWYNNSLLVIQAFFSFVGITFSGVMLALGRDATIYLPLMTGLIMIWCPSPLSHKISQQPIPTPPPSSKTVRTPRTPQTTREPSNLLPPPNILRDTTDGLNQDTRLTVI